MGNMGLMFTSLLVRHLLGSLGLFGPMTSIFGLMDAPNSPKGIIQLRMPKRMGGKSFTDCQ